MDITPENALYVQHKEWLNHPVTHQFMQNLETKRKTFINSMSASANQADVPDDVIRRWAYGLQTLDSIKQQLTDTETFIKLLNNK